MKLISPEQKEYIDALIAESVSAPIAPAIYEKDLLVTEILNAVSGQSFVGAQLLFAGGTSLSKGFGLLERMSEDIDFKVLVDDPAISNAARRKLLSNIKLSISQTLEDLGFTTIEVSAHSANQVVSLQARYQPYFSMPEGMRDFIAIDLNARNIRYNSTSRSICSLLDKQLVAFGKQENLFQINCVIPSQTAAEKILALLRRLEQHEAGLLSEPFDPALVRHLYDIWQIQHSAFADIEQSKQHFQLALASDIQAYARQFPEFAENPQQVLLRGLQLLESHQLCQESYCSTLANLIFANELVDYTVAYETFAQFTSELIEA